MTGKLLATLVLLSVLAGPAFAESVVARHTIRSQSIINAEDLQVVQETLPGAIPDPAFAIGLEARVVLYAGRPVRMEDLRSPAMIERNQIVTLVFRHGRLAITTDGRSLARAAIGERVRVMNLESRSTVSGTVDEAGRVIVGPSRAEIE